MYEFCQNTWLLLHGYQYRNALCRQIVWLWHLPERVKWTMLTTETLTPWIERKGLSYISVKGKCKREKVWRGRGESIDRRSSEDMSVRCVSVCFVMMGSCSISELVVKPCVLQRTRTKRHEERKLDERISDRSSLLSQIHREETVLFKPAVSQTHKPWPSTRKHTLVCLFLFTELFR